MQVLGSLLAAAVIVAVTIAIVAGKLGDNHGTYPDEREDRQERLEEILDD